MQAHSAPTPAADADPARTPVPTPRLQVAVVGGGPAGLMAAEGLLQAGLDVHLFDAMPTVGRKFLLAGKGGLNLTHSEPLEPFIARYGGRAPWVGRWLKAFGPSELRAWSEALGVSTFVGSSGRVFPREMKAAPLLRAWLHLLKSQGLQLHCRHRWSGWQPGDAATLLRLLTPDGPRQLQPAAVVLALGGASWPQLGSDGAWTPWLQARGVDVAPLRPSNCGFDVGWSPYFAQRFAGAPLKTVRLCLEDGTGEPFDQPGEFVATATGIEGSLVYAVSARLREAIARDGQATIRLDLLPGRSETALAQALARGRGARSWPSHLKEAAGLQGVKAALLRERWSAEELSELLARQPGLLAREIKAWPLRVLAPRPVAEAISTAGGVRLEDLDERGMLRTLPGVFCAGEMLDWEAPTGGYLLSACMASGAWVASGVRDWLGAGSLTGSARSGRP